MVKQDVCRLEISVHHICLVKEAEGTQHSKQDLGCMLLREANVVLGQCLFQITVHIIHHDKNVSHIFGDDEVENLDCVHVLLHLREVPQYLYFS